MLGSHLGVRSAYKSPAGRTEAIAESFHELPIFVKFVRFRSSYSKVMATMYTLNSFSHESTDAGPGVSTLTTSPVGPSKVLLLKDALSGLGDPSGSHIAMSK